jgi:hypothetical protein
LTPQDNEPSVAEKRAQVARVINSGVLHNAPMLQKLLEFVAARAFAGDTADVNEITLASKVFARSDDFDPTADTTVRTSVYRLRMKLRDYYAGTGKLDPVVIEIPKGHYTPLFRKRGSEGVHADSGPLEGEPPPTAPVPRSAGRSPLPPWLLLVALLLFGLGLLIGAIWKRPVGAAAEKADVLTAFWRSFAGDDRSVIITYSNAELLQTDTRDLLRYDVGAVDDRGAEVDHSLARKYVAIPEFLRSHSLFYEDGYSGTGEVHAVFFLTRLLTRAGIDVLVKRVRLLTTDDLKSHNVVLLGSSLENRAVDELRLKQGFVFEFPAGSNSSWNGRIVDQRGPAGAHSSSYAVERDPKTGALRTDYAIFSLMPGVVANHRVMLLGGLTTSGTQGAAEFATTEQSMAALLAALARPGHPSQSGPPPCFESTLEVQVVRGLDPTSIRRLSVRAISE